MTHVINFSEYPTASVAIICFASGMRQSPLEMFRNMNSHARRKYESLTRPRYVNSHCGSPCAKDICSTFGFLSINAESSIGGR